MATTTRTLDANVNGTVYTANANDALEALDTCHSGATAPTDEVANGKLWLDTSTTPGILKIYNNATWEVVLTATGTSQVKLDGIEALADVTDTANVTAAGALMDSEVTNLAQVKAFSSADYATAAQGTLADSAVQPNDTVTLGTVTATAFAGDGSSLTDVPLAAGLYPAKAWVNFNGTGVVAIRDSGNIASLVDNGQGDYGVSLTGSFSSTSFTAVMSGTNEAALTLGAGPVTRTASSLRLVTSQATSGNMAASTRADHKVVNLLAHGELA